MNKNDSSNQTQTIYTLGQTVVAAMGNKMASISAAMALLLLAGSASAQSGRMGMRSASAGARTSSVSTRPTSTGTGITHRTPSNLSTRQPSSSVRQPFTNGGRQPRNPMNNPGRVTGFRNHDIPVHGFRGHDVFGWSGGGSYLVPEPVYTDVAAGYPVATEVAPAVAPAYPEPAYAAAPCGCQAAAPVAAAYPVYPAPVAVPAMVSVPVGPMVMGFGGYYGGHVGGPWRHHPVRRFGRR